ncbi:MAG: hypothetical protein HOC23_04200 [Halieaceae bacterium]|nr:hypothetical protein [Halieaceae bacterium]
MADIFDIQDEVAQAITAALNVTLAGEDVLARDRPTQNLEAYNAYLEGLSFVGGDLRSLRLSLSRFDYAVALDPTFVDAWVARAEAAYMMVGDSRAAGSESLERARAYILDALALDPDEPYMRALEAGSRLGDDYDWYNEMVVYDEAILVVPADVRSPSAQLWSLVEAGYWAEALGMGEKIVALDPLSPLVNTRYGAALYANGQLDAARQQFTMAVDRGFEEASYFYFVDRLLDNDPEGAIAIYDTIGKVEKKDMSAVRTLVEAEFRGENVDRNLAATLNIGVGIVPLISLGRGRLDAFYDDLLAMEMGDAFTVADTLTYVAMAFPQTGITAHPRFLELAESMQMIGVWEKRGAPDMCTKEADTWVCE